MDFRFKPEEEAFREEFVSWLKKNLPTGYDPSRYRNYQSTEEWALGYRDLQRRLSEGGYAAMHYPKEYGGGGKSFIEEVIVLQSIASVCNDLRFPGVVSHSIVSPTVLTVGTEEQKRKFLPKILNGTHFWCQGFSEPDAGSDLANVCTRAVRHNDHYVVNGQKVWTSWAHTADYCMAVVRTNPDVGKHNGLSFLLIDMKLPGVEVSPMKQITGEVEFNEVFFDDVRVPEDMRLGQEGQGWKIALTSLMFERVLGDVVLAAAYRKNIDLMIEMARQRKRAGESVIEDPIFRQQLAQAYIEVAVLKYHGLRSLSHQLQGGMPGPEGSIGKLLWSEPNQRICEAAMGMQGPNGQIMEGSPWSIQDGYWQYHFLRAKGNTIEAGTSEILRNIIAERVLGLPKDAARDSGKERKPK